VQGRDVRKTGVALGGMNFLRMPCASTENRAGTGQAVTTCVAVMRGAACARELVVIPVKAYISCARHSVAPVVPLFLSLCAHHREQEGEKACSTQYLSEQQNSRAGNTLRSGTDSWRVGVQAGSRQGGCSLHSGCAKQTAMSTKGCSRHWQGAAQ
jgi:hypothetical protein